ncbi:subtilisin-like protease SBT1.4 [Tripterygium wilfordii]|uniref:subtilisin-like protease SBT1.4 n=1 Tax=Tripterygium wilfordii TaxID=458696 RepID=UPI0018F83253|nr:subtilisin-like protease SBT1.4 [Tripterygium wilfordii]
MAVSIVSSIIFLFLSFTPTALSNPSSDHRQTYIVHVSRSHKPRLFSSHLHWYTSIIQSLPPSTHSAEILYTYELAINGFSAPLTNSQVAKLRELPGILSVIPDRARHLQTTRTPSFLGLNDSYGLWQNSNHGDGVIIGVIDSGIWPEHRSFSDAGLSPVPARWKGKCETAPDFPASACNRKLIGARTFYKGHESYLGRPITESNEVVSPRDREGHGTHCASTAAGSKASNASFNGYAYGEARGVASKARIALYKLCFSKGCFDSDILAAMDQAIADGVDVISLSVGTRGYSDPYDKDSIAIGAFGAVERGVIVSCAAGNTGPGPRTAVNIAPWILTVGASTIDRDFPVDVVLGNGRIFNSVSLYSGDPLPDFKLPLVYAGDCGNRYCHKGNLDPTKVKGKIVLCDNGGPIKMSRVEKGNIVKVAGGLGMIVANTEAEGEKVVAEPHILPSTMVGQIVGDQIRDYIKLDQNPTATIVFHGTVTGISSPPAPKVAVFSSRGPNYITPVILKPDVIAPGVSILAAWTGASGPSNWNMDSRRVEFNIISGTSMACPHVSGIVALLRKAYPKWSPAAVKSALMTTAFNLDNSRKNITDLATGEDSTPFVHGAGHVDPNRAMDPGLVYDIDSSNYIAFLCSIGYGPKQIAIFTREPASPDACARKLVSPGDLNYPAFSIVFKSDGDVVNYKRVVKNVGSSASAVYRVKVIAPENVVVNVSPRKLVFDNKTKTASYQIRFSSIGRGSFSNTLTSFGSIEWSDGVHRVRSAIAVQWNEGLKDSI